VDLPKPGTLIEAGKAMGTVESVKSVSELFAPVSGQVTEVNPALAEAPEKLNRDPEGEAWLIKVKLTSPDEIAALMDAAAYAAFVKKA
jgi:glycine cleavage system H protein